MRSHYYHCVLQKPEFGTIQFMQSSCSKTMTGAFGLLCTISSSAFIIAFQVNQCMFEYTVSLSKLLQGSTQDVLWVYEEATLVQDIVIDIRQIADADYSEI